ncbi:MAG TPA: hypothetical protein VF463_04320 [Sphingobium sp.]
MTMFKQGMAALALAGMTGCTSPVDHRPASLSDRQSKELAKALDGKMAGRPVACVSRGLGSDGLHAVTDELLLYRVNRNLIYRNDLHGSCSGISRGSALVLQPANDQFCRGDFAWSVDFSTGMRGPSCVLGNFIPYRTADN